MLRDPENIERQFLYDILGPSAGDVLEVGCGDGRLTAELLKISDNVLAIDPDPDSIRKARNMLAGGIKLVLGSGEDIPLTDRCVDTIIFSLSLHHHPDPGKALMETRRVLKDGGQILVLEPEAEAPTNQLYRLINDEDDAYDNAVKAIDRCGLATAGNGTYETLWRFDDFDEMVEYLFDYYDVEPDREITDNMVLLLGDRRSLTPLDMTDITRYWLLKDAGGDRAQVP